MTRAVLLALALTFPGAATLQPDRAVDEVLSITTNDTETRVLLGFGYFESLWGKWTLGDCTCWELTDGPWWGLGWRSTDCPNYADRHLENCRAFGPMQTWDPAKWVPGATPAKVVVDRVLGYRVGLEIFRHAMRECGSNVRSALGLYASGQACGAASAKIAARCAWIGC